MERDLTIVDRLITVSVDVHNLVAINWLVPAERVAPHVPDAFELETFDMAGREMCFVTTTSFCNRDFRWSLVPYPRHTFDEMTFRTYVTSKGRAGVYFFRRYLSTTLAVASQRVFEMHVTRGEFDVVGEAGADPVDGYQVTVRAEEAEARFELENEHDPPDVTTPFEDEEELTHYFTYRLHGFFRSSAGLPGHMPVEHPRIRPRRVRLVDGAFPFWLEAGILDRGEMLRPHSALYQARVPFKLYPPRPASGRTDAGSSAPRAPR